MSSDASNAAAKPKIPAPGLWADQDKKQKDTQNGDFYVTNFKAEYTGAVTKCVDLNGHMVQNFDDRSVKATLVPKFCHCNSGTTVKATVDSSQYLKIDAANDKLFKGARVNVVVEKASTIKGKFTTEYKHDKFGTATTISADGPQGPVHLDSSLVVPVHANVVLGTAFNVANVGVDNELKSAKGAAWFKDANSVVGITFESTSGSMCNRGLNANATLYHKVNAQTELGASAFYDIKGDKAPLVGAGAVHKLRDDTTVRCRITSNGDVAGALTQRLNTNVEVTVAVHSNINRGLGSGKDNKLGVHYSYKK